MRPLPINPLTTRTATELRFGKIDIVRDPGARILPGDGHERLVAEDTAGEDSLPGNRVDPDDLPELCRGIIAGNEEIFPHAPALNQTGIPCQQDPLLSSSNLDQFPILHRIEVEDVEPKNPHPPG